MVECKSFFSFKKHYHGGITVAGVGVGKSFDDLRIRFIWIIHEYDTGLLFCIIYMYLYIYMNKFSATQL